MCIVYMIKYCGLVLSDWYTMIVINPLTKYAIVHNMNADVKTK